MREGFGPGESRARARGCTCSVGGDRPTTTGCPLHSGLVGGQLQLQEDVELFDNLKRRVGMKRAMEIWEVADRARPERTGWSMPSRLEWAEKKLKEEEQAT